MKVTDSNLVEQQTQICIFTTTKLAGKKSSSYFTDIRKISQNNYYYYDMATCTEDGHKKIAETSTI